MAEALVTVVLEQLRSILSEQIETGVRLVVDVEEEVEKLTSNFQSMRAVIDDAENRQVKENVVREWLDKLKDVSYDIEDVLDEWITEIQKQQMSSNDVENSSIAASKRKVWSFIPSYCFSPRQVCLRHDIATKIKNLNKKLDCIAREKDMFNFSLIKGTGELVRPMTTSVIDVSEIHGRVSDKKSIISLLLRETSQEIVSSPPIISIVGMGGIGKTTLARLTFNDNEVKTYFDKKVWVCVSDPFDEIRIAKAILESLTDVAPNLVELETILRHIRKFIENKKFFLVLDDVWNEDPRSWEQLRDTLKCCSEGSRILVTTRKENVAKMMGTTHKISIGKLSKQECWSLFSQVAFSRMTTGECDKFKDIAEKIVDKCNGLPLAVKTLGSLLSLKCRAEQWQSVLDSELWALKEVESGLFPPLLLSYYDLPSVLRKCFSYCAIFPKDYTIEKDKLIKLWMAQGYLRVEGRDDMELIGEEYFENLALRSFFQDFEKSEHDGSIIRCKMHDIVHDFAQFLTKEECFTIEVGAPNKSLSKFSHNKARHSMIVLKRKDSFPISVYNKTKLRSLVVECGGNLLNGINLPKLFDQLTHLRTIDFISNENDIFDASKELPRGVSKLMHLRYLNLSRNSKIKNLSETLCDLYNLQTLDLTDCKSLQKLPQGMGKLINMRHLIIEGTYSLSYMPKGMEKLTSLRTLSKFVESSGEHGSKACTVECLRNLNNLEGTLSLRRLGNVRDFGEAQKAELKSKKKLLYLSLHFYKHEFELEGQINKEHEAVLEALEPPQNLEELDIYGYESITLSPSWMVSLTKLRVLKLKGCPNCGDFPSLGNLPSLESLVIIDMWSLRRVGNRFLGVSSSTTVAFPKLKSLEFRYMPKWEEWDCRLIGEDIGIMPCLRQLKIVDCPELKALPKYILHKTNLEKLVICSCPILGNRYQMGKGKDWRKISHVRKIEISPNLSNDFYYLSDYSLQPPVRLSLA